MHARVQAVHIDEALERAQRFADIGADVLFIDALESAEEMRRFAADLPGAAAGVPKMASMLEGGGKTPMMSQRELDRMGFKLVAYPLSMLGVSVRAMQSALSVRSPRLPRCPPPSVLAAVCRRGALRTARERAPAVCCTLPGASWRLKRRRMHEHEKQLGRSYTLVPASEVGQSGCMPQHEARADGG